MLNDGELFDICFNYQNEWISNMNFNEQIVSIKTINVFPDITYRDFYFGVIEENNRPPRKLKIG